MDILQDLAKWYTAQCNGEWEHSCGLKIDTLDNPGWIVTIDLKGNLWSDGRLLSSPMALGGTTSRNQKTGFRAG